MMIHEKAYPGGSVCLSKRDKKPADIFIFYRLPFFQHHGQVRRHLRQQPESIHGSTLCIKVRTT